LLPVAFAESCRKVSEYCRLRLAVFPTFARLTPLGLAKGVGGVHARGERRARAADAGH